MASACLIQNLLPIVDDLKHAVAAIPSEIADSDWVQGIALIEHKLGEILRQEGVCRVEAGGEDFDPWEHEAVMTEDGEEEGKIVHVLQEGYKLHDKLLRPARVVVTKRKADEDKED
jgi:molecular chaperone GrpE